MKDLIMKMVKESVWIQVQKDFHEFTMKHCEKLNYKEQLVFMNLINSGDEYSHAILDNLWQEFEIEGCSKERIQELFDIEVKQLTQGVNI
jgi:hypothetical protein